MPKRRPEVLPKEVEKALREMVASLRHGLWLISEGRPDTDALPFFQVLDPALEAARKVAGEKRPRNRVVPKEVTFADIAADRVRQFRTDRGWTQAELAAEASAQVGLNWKRQTVAEIENGLRRTSLEELRDLARLFDVPMVTFLLPSETEVISVRDGLVGRPLFPEDARRVILGDEGGEDR